MNIAVRMKKWVDEQYEHGRVTVISDKELDGLVREEAKKEKLNLGTLRYGN